MIGDFFELVGKETKTTSKCLNQHFMLIKLLKIHFYLINISGLTFQYTQKVQL